MASLKPVAYLDDNGKGIADLAALLVEATEAANDFANTNNDLLVVDNTSSASVTLTIKAEEDPYGRGSPANDQVITIAAGKIAFVPFLNIRAWGGTTRFVLSAFADVNVGVIRMLKKG
jgi:hypothetical protein